MMEKLLERLTSTTTAATHSVDSRTDRFFSKLDWAYHEAFEKEIGIYGSSYTNTMMVELGETLHFAAGSDKNIKLTTQDDLDLFKGYLERADSHS